MNKLTAAVLAAAMLGSMAMPAFAEDTTVQPVNGTTNSTTDNTVVKYEVTQGYTWKIHSEIDFGKDRTATQGTTTYDSTQQKITNGDGNSKNVVEVTKNVIPSGKKLVIKVQGNGGGTETTTSAVAGEFKIKETASTNQKTLDYTVTSSAITANSGNITAGSAVLTVEAGTNTGKTYMTFVLDTTSQDAEFAGSYEGRVVYTASIE